MGEGVGGDGEDVIRGRVSSALHEGMGAGHGGKRHRAARRDTERDVMAFSGSSSDIHHVGEEAVFDVNLCGLFSKGKKVIGRDDGAKGQSGAPAAALQDLDLVLTGRIADGDADHEAVGLRLGELLCAGGAERILRRHDDEGLRDGVGLAVDREAPFLHDLKERGLCLRGGAVDLIGEEEIRHRAAGDVAKAAGGFVIHGKSRDIRGQDIGGELHTLVVKPERAGEGDGHGRLAHAGDVIDQDMAACQDGGQYTAEHIVLAQDGFACLSENGVYGFFGIHEGLLYLYPTIIQRLGRVDAGGEAEWLCGMIRIKSRAASRDVLRGGWHLCYNSKKSYATNL